MLDLITIEARKTVLESQKQATLDKANLALVPIQAQTRQLENEAQKIILEATQTVAGLDGRLAVLEELRLELVPPAPVDTDAAQQLP